MFSTMRLLFSVIQHCYNWLQSRKSWGRNSVSDLPLLRLSSWLLNPGDGHLTKTSPRPVWTADHTVHAQPDVGLDLCIRIGKGWFSDRPTIQNKEISAVVHSLVTAVVGDLHSFVTDIIGHVITKGFPFFFNRQVAVCCVVLVTSKYVGIY